MTEREIISKILSVEKEQVARKSDNLMNYNTNVVHIKQMEFHKCLKKNRWVFGGNRSGKTECGAVESVWIARGIHPYRENRNNTFGWVVSLSREVQRDVAQSKILKYLSPRYIYDIIMVSGKKGSPEYGMIDHIVIKNSFGGLSKIGFKSCDQGREKFQGTSLDYVWFDEEPPQDIYDECKMRVFDRCGIIFGTMTPLKGLTWVYDVVEINSSQNPEIWCNHMEWNDNPYLDKNEVKNMMNVTSESEQLSRRFGKFNTAEGLVYPEFNSDIHVIEPFDIPREWQSNIAIDPGLRNPTSCHFYAVDYDGVIYVIDEHYESGKDIDYHAEKIKQIAKKLDWHFDNKGRLEALIDSASNQRTLASQKSVAELFFERDIMVNTRVNKDLYSGIQRIKSLFCQNPPKIYIFKNCVNMIKELKSYWWGANDRPKKIDDHSLDELRYFVMSLPEAPKLTKPQITMIEKDKQNLIKTLKRGNEWMRKF